MIASTKNTARVLFLVQIIVLCLTGDSLAKPCRLSYKQLPRLSGSYDVKGTEMDTELDETTKYSYEMFKASSKGAYALIKTREVNEDGDKVTITGAWQPLTTKTGQFLTYQYLGVDIGEEDDRYFITPTKLSSSCKVLEFTMTVFHELDDLCESDVDDRQASESDCLADSNVHYVGQYFGKLK